MSKLYYSPSTRGFYDEEIHGARTNIRPDPNWKRPLKKIPQPFWQPPNIQVPDPNWKRPNKFVFDPAWSPSQIQVPDPAWIRPTIQVPDPNWKRPTELLLDPKTKPGEDGLVPLVQRPISSAVPPLIDVPDINAQPPLIEVDDPLAIPNMIEVLDEAAMPPLIEVPDLSVPAPLIEVPDEEAKPPLIEVPNWECKLPPDAIPITAQEHQDLLAAQQGGSEIVPGADGKPVTMQPVVSAEEVQKRLEAMIQGHLDSQARSMGYDNIMTAISYAEEPAVPKFQDEGRRLREWRSLVWEKANKILGDVLADSRSIPTKQQLLSELPTF